MRIATFNVQNMRLRQAYGHPRLDGARDTDDPVDSGALAARWDKTDRELTAILLRRVDANIVALQEVFDRETLDHFHDRFLLPTGLPPYPYRICLPGNDGRGQDVALLSRTKPNRVISHAELTPDDLGLETPEGISTHTPIFRRDCLEVHFDQIALFVCHFKAPYPDPVSVWPVRRLEALATRTLIQRRFPKPETESWLVLGDLNDPIQPPDGRDRAIAPLLPPFSENLMARLPQKNRWSYHDPHRDLYSRPDKLLASPALAGRFPASVPVVHRSGMGLEARRFTGPHLQGVGLHRPHASDHAAISVDFPGLR